MAEYPVADDDRISALEKYDMFLARFMFGKTRKYCWYLRYIPCDFDENWPLNAHAISNLVVRGRLELMFTKYGIKSALVRTDDEKQERYRRVNWYITTIRYSTFLLGRCGVTM